MQDFIYNAIRFTMQAAGVFLELAAVVALVAIITAIAITMPGIV